MSSRDRSNAMFLVLRLFWYVISSIAIGFYRNFVPYSLQKKKNLDGKLILITGAGGGIGYELATKLALSRCRLILWDVVAENNERTAETCRKLGAEVHAYEVDITDRKKVYAIAEKIEFEIGPVDILINNAAVINSCEFLKSNDTMMDRLLDINAKSIFWTTKAFLPTMLHQKSGHIVTISSVAGIIGAPGLVDYSMSKFAVFGFMEALENELLSLGHDYLNFTTVCPIFVNTTMIEKLDTSKFPVLEVENVVERIVRAIKINQRVLMVPNQIYLLYALKGIIPWNLYRSIIIKKEVKYA